VDNKIVNWIIDLQGKPHDLEDCAELFKETEILVEREQSGGSIPRYYLHSSKFKGLADTQIHTVAGELMNELNSALKSRTGGGPVILGIPVTIRADGSRVPVKAVTAVSRMQTESLTAIHNVQGVPIESLAAVSHVEAVPIEHLTGVSNVGAMPIESLRSKVRRLWVSTSTPLSCISSFKSRD
jgi:hypothetical protein